MKKNVKTRRFSDVIKASDIPFQDLNIIDKEIVIKTDSGENIYMKITKDYSPENYILIFKREGEYKKAGTLSFKFNKNNGIYINDIIVFSGEKNLGWCSFMIQTLINLIKKWEEESLIKIEYISLLNVSINYNHGNIAGTVCYIKNIGKYFPWFVFKNKTYYLRDFNLELDPNIWLPEIGIDVKYNEETKDWSGEGDYFFYKNKPPSKVNDTYNYESILHKTKRSKRTKRSTRNKRSKRSKRFSKSR